ncbi:TPA: hypothetical protein H2W70_004157 [Salmonella enterica]|nr:hypothetical protein [Salmonella enterica]HAK8195258.1 hypothetical protein [Salmonella enterica]HAK8434606.1 hypothetical protein [Salmonella enterica]HAK8462354.1 hypothetical protein [Salmonella enterica]
MKFRFIHLPAFTHKTAFSSGHLLLDDSENKLSDDALQKLLRRHTSGDWGDVPRSLRQTNRYALEYSNSLLSCYFHPFNGIRMVTISTSADRSQTVISVHA